MPDIKKSLKQKITNCFPGGLKSNAEIIGFNETLKLIFGTAFSYRTTALYYVKNRKFRSLYNFFYVKALVPVGEGAGAGLYFFIGPLVRKHPHIAPYPRYIEIEMTTICDKKCILCEHTYWKDQEERHLEFEEFKHIVNQFPKLKWVNLTGEGDAFLNPDYIEMIKYLKSKEIPVFLVDSFDNIDEEIARQLVEIGVDGIYVSMDGATKKTYNRIKLGCNLDRSLRNIRNLLEIKKELKSPTPELCFRYVINTINVNEIPAFVDIVSSLGTRNELGDGSRIEYCGILEFEGVEHLKVMNVPDSLIMEAIEKSRVKKIPVFFAHCDQKTHPPLEHCLAWMEPYFMMGGYVMPCCSVMMSNKRTFLREHALGNIFSSDFKSIWNSERYRRFRSTINNPNASVPLLCKGCRAYNTEDRVSKYGVDESL